jgi:hypothetical protein
MINENNYPTHALSAHNGHFPFINSQGSQFHFERVLLLLRLYFFSSFFFVSLVRSNFFFFHRPPLSRLHKKKGYETNYHHQAVMEMSKNKTNAFGLAQSVFKENNIIIKEKKRKKSIS